MDADRFDALSRALTTTRSRRTTLRALLGTLLGSALLEASPDTLAERHRRNGKGRDTKSGRVKADHDNDAGKDHRRPHKPSATDQQIPDLNEEVAAVEARDGAGGEVSASLVCRPAGTGCKRGGQCCTGKCLHHRKCSCDASNPCPTPADPCTQAVCSSTGRCAIQALACDDGNECTDNVCSGGVCSHPPRPVGAACSTGVCDGLQCVECLTPADCPGQDTGCGSRVCASGFCGIAGAPAGTACNESGGRVCNGAGRLCGVRGPHRLPGPDESLPGGCLHRQHLRLRPGGSQHGLPAEGR